MTCHKDVVDTSNIIIDQCHNEETFILDFQN